MPGALLPRATLRHAAPTMGPMPSKVFRVAAAMLLAASALGCPGGGGNAPDRSVDAGGLSPDGGVFVGETEQAFADALTGHRARRHHGDLRAIRKRGVLRVITRNNSTGYFLYRGREAGFFVEVAALLAAQMGVRLQMVVPNARRDLVPYLLDGRGDIIMSGMAIHSERLARVALSDTTLETPWVVVMRSPDAAKVKKLGDIRGIPLSLVPSAGGLKVVRQLNARLHAGLKPAAVPENLEAEDVLDLVAAGEARAAVVPGRIATVELAHERSLARALELPGGPERSAWAVRREDKALLAYVNGFLRQHKRGAEWNILYKRYHSPGERTRRMREPDWRADKTGALTRWDAEFQAAAREAGLDWRLLAAQAYQESRFDPRARSEAGAVGLMQILPSTARELGVQDLTNPTDSLRAAARYMHKLVRAFPPDMALKDRVRMALAAYNVGLGHVKDARHLARRLGRSTDRWFGHVEKALLLLSRPRYYKKAHHGFCRGDEPVRYVSEIQSRYDAYVSMTEHRSDPAPSSPAQ